jgi:DNA-binding NarL/FixJ family response regulator
MNILIADDHAIVRKGLIQLLREEFRSAQVTEASNSDEVCDKARGKIWDIILLDISMPGRNGVDILKQLRAEGTKAPILMLSMHPEDQYAVRVLKAGASGFLNKDSATEELIKAIHKVLSGKKYISASLAEKLAEGAVSSDKPAHELLSDREMQVFQLLASGKTVGEVADEISLSVNTISTYRARVLEKLGLNNNAELTRYAMDHDMV